MDWKAFKQGFLSINVQLNPKEITDFEVCAIGKDDEAGFVSPENKKVTGFSLFYHIY